MAGLVKVCWEYPTFIQANFKIYRKETFPNSPRTLIAEVSPTERAYYDYTAQPGVLYQYDVEAVLQGAESSPAGAEGLARQFNRLSGRIYSHQTGIGTPDVRVELINPINGAILNRFYSDSSGYYLVENIPVPDGTNLIIRAYGIATDFNQINGIQASIDSTMTISTGTQNYVYDFVNYFEPVRFPIDTVAPPIRIE